MSGFELTSHCMLIPKRRLPIISAPAGIGSGRLSPTLWLRQIVPFNHSNQRFFEVAKACRMGDASPMEWPVLADSVEKVVLPKVPKNLKAAGASFV
jgi:hypothetical protein